MKRRPVEQAPVLVPDDLARCHVEDWVTPEQAVSSARKVRHNGGLTITDVMGEASLGAFMAQRRVLHAWCDEHNVTREHRAEVMARSRPMFRDGSRFGDQARRLMAGLPQGGGPPTPLSPFLTGAVATILYETEPTTRMCCCA